MSRANVFLTVHPHPLTSAILLMLATHAGGIVVRGYSPARHDRFASGFPAAPVMNPGFLHDASKFTGVGWWFSPGNPSASEVQFAAVTPRHVLSVRHWASNFTEGDQLVRFLGADGSVETRTLAPFTNLTRGTSLLDLAVVSLSAPLPATVELVRYRNSRTESQLENSALIVLGKTARGGSGTLDGFQTLTYAPYSDGTRMVRFDYTTSGGGADDVYYGPATGDSSSPVFVDHGGKPALVGVAAIVDNDNPAVWRNYAASIPEYVAEIDAVLAGGGYRLRPVQYVTTTLGLASALAPAGVRQGYPGTATFTLTNTGGQPTGNIDLRVTFPAGQAPAALAAPAGWVVEPLAGGAWSVRRATFAAADMVVVTATWPALPAVGTLQPAVTVTTDTDAAAAASPVYTLPPSFAGWAAALPERGEQDDPDADGLENLLEYALGGDAESGAMTLGGTHPLLPVLTVSGGVATLSHAEREDAALRGLSYIVETAATPEALDGATALPAGTVSATEPFDPPVPGFVKRTLTWPVDGARRFARVKVELGE